jgi:hypothetical protein
MTIDEANKMTFMIKILTTINNTARVQSSNYAKTISVLAEKALDGTDSFDIDFFKTLDASTLDVLLSNNILTDDEMADAIDVLSNMPDQHGWCADRLIFLLSHSSSLVRWSALCGLGKTNHYKNPKVLNALNNVLNEKENIFFKEMAKAILEDAKNG